MGVYGVCIRMWRLGVGILCLFGLFCILGFGIVVLVNIVYIGEVMKFKD